MWKHADQFEGCCSNPGGSWWWFEPQMNMFLYQELLCVNKIKAQEKHSRKLPKLTNKSLIMGYKSLIIRERWIKTIIWKKPSYMTLCLFFWQKLWPDTAKFWLGYADLKILLHCLWECRIQKWCNTAESSIHITWTSQVVPVIKNPPANAGDTGHAGLIPALGRYLGEGNGNPLHYCCLVNSMERGAWGGYSPWSHKESDTTDHTTAIHILMTQQFSTLLNIPENFPHRFLREWIRKCSLRQQGGESRVGLHNLDSGWVKCVSGFVISI